MSTSSSDTCGRQSQHRQADLVGPLQGVGGQLAHVRTQLHRDRDDAATGQRLELRGQVVLAVEHRVAGGDEQLVVADERQDVRRLPDADAHHLAVERPAAGQHLDAVQRREGQRLGERDAVGGGLQAQAAAPCVGKPDPRARRSSATLVMWAA